MLNTHALSPCAIQEVSVTLVDLAGKAFFAIPSMKPLRKSQEKSLLRIWRHTGHIDTLIIMKVNVHTLNKRIKKGRDAPAFLPESQISIN